MLIVLIAIYTLALCIGTIAGNVISQGFLTAAILIFPALLPSLISGVIAVHSSADFHENNGIIHNVMENIRISSPAEDFNIYFNYDPQSAYTDQNGVRHNEPNFTKIPGKNIAIVHTIILLPLGIYLYARSINERNGNFIISKTTKVVLACAIFFGDRWRFNTKSSALIFQLLHRILVTSFITYFFLPKILKWKVSWN